MKQRTESSVDSGNGRSPTGVVIVRGVFGGWIRESRLNDIAGAQALEQLRLDLRQEQARCCRIVLGIAFAFRRGERIRGSLKLGKALDRIEDVLVPKGNGPA